MKAAAPSTTMRRAWPLIGFVLLSALLAAGLKLNPREVPSPFIGRPAPPFTLPLLHEPGRTLSPRDLEGQVWILNVWASWCAPCREEHPLLMAVAQDHAVPMIGINYKDDPRNAKEWLLRLGDPYKTSIVDRDGRASIDYGVYGVPETFVIDRQGVVRLKHIGPLTDAAWRQKVQPLLEDLRR